MGGRWLRAGYEARLRALVLSSLAEPMKVKAKGEVPRSTVAGVQVGPYRDGELVELPGLLALALAASGRAELGEESLEVELYRAQSRERAGQTPGALQLSQLRQGFYRRTAIALAALELAGQKERAERVSAIYQDLITLRLSKISRALGYTSVPSSLPSMSEEEAALFGCASRMFKSWREIVRGEGLWR